MRGIRVLGSFLPGVKCRGSFFFNEEGDSRGDQEGRVRLMNDCVGFDFRC